MPVPASHPAESAPPRSVALALRSMLVLGVACTLFGLIFVVAFGFLNTFQRFRPWFVTMGLILWLGPGVSYLWSAYLMRSHRRGGATSGLITTVVQFVGAGGLLVASMSFSPVTPLPILLCALWVIALADCMRHLLRARRFLASGTERMRGFEPLLAWSVGTPNADARREVPKD